MSGGGSSTLDFALYADAVISFVTSAPSLQEWPACRQVLVDRLSQQPPWIPALPVISCLAAGGSLADGTPIASAWIALQQAAIIHDVVQDGDDDLPPGIDAPAVAFNVGTALIFAGLRFLTAGGTSPQLAERIV